jgi:hypothetical protein
MILALAGEEPESVYATGGNYLHKKIADVTTTHLEFPSGLRAHIFVSWLHPFKEQKLVVVGDKKMAVFDDTQPWSDKLLLYPHEIKWQDNIPVPAKADPERLEIPENEPLRLECEHFLGCLSNGSKPLTDGNEGLRVLKILNASQKSLDQNGCKILFGQKSEARGQRSEDRNRKSGGYLSPITQNQSPNASHPPLPLTQGPSPAKKIFSRMNPHISMRGSKSATAPKSGTSPTSCQVQESERIATSVRM